MVKTFNPDKINMALCPICNGKGKLPKNPNGFDACRRCGGFGVIKKESEIFKKPEVNSQSQSRIED